MKKSLLLLLLAGSTYAQAQITMDYAGYSAWATKATPDTLKLLSDQATYPNLTPQANGSWDLTSYTYGSGSRYWFTQPYSNASVPAANYNERIFYSFSSQFTYDVLSLRSLDATGNKWQGEELETRQAFTLSTLTGDTDDSLVFPAQLIPYSAPQTFIQFPATMGSTWSSDANFSTAFNITVGMYGLNNTPGERRARRMVADTVAGWGKVKIKDVSGATTTWIDVLVIKETRSVTDSFYLGGAPAPAPMLSAFGLSQGMVTTNNQYFYVRAGETTPLVDVRFDENAPFDNAQIEYIAVMQNRLPYPTAVSNVVKTDVFSVYPNPTTSKAFTLQLANGYNKAYQYQVVDINGRKVADGKIAGTETKVALPEDSASGLYFVTLYDNNIKVSSTMISVQ